MKNHLKHLHNRCPYTPSPHFPRTTATKVVTITFHAIVLVILVLFKAENLRQEGGKSKNLQAHFALLNYEQCGIT